MAASVPEVLLALAGYESPLFDASHREHFSSITPPEAAALESLGRLASIHRALQERVKQILREAPSLICRAIAERIDSFHLPQFLDAIIAFERDVLLRDSSVVGAYEIVSLSLLVNTFSPWTRKITFLWSIASTILPSKGEAETQPERPAVFKAAEILDKLRSDVFTGYEDIEKAAKDLIGIAEGAWLKQLSTWILIGETPEITHCDFFIRPKRKDQQGLSRHTIVSKALPEFLSQATAKSILFLGITFRRLGESDSIEQERNSRENVRSRAKDFTVHTARLEPLKNVSSPIDVQVFDVAISQIRARLGRELAEGVLPTSSILSTLRLSRQFLLGGRTDFVERLINEADIYLQTRNKTSSRQKNATGSALLTGFMIEGPEIGQVLNKTWAAIAPSLNSQTQDQELEWAREHLKLMLAPEADETSDLKHGNSDADDEASDAIASLEVPDSPLKDLLLSTSTIISLMLPPSLNLFFSPQDKMAYTTLNSLIVATSRGREHLLGLWRQTKLRRNHVPLVNHTVRGSERSMAPIQKARKKNEAREAALRNVWASAEAVVRLLTEFSNFISVDVIEDSWSTFYSWAAGGEVPDSNNIHQDLEELAKAHRNYLVHLLHATMLDEKECMTKLRHLLVTCDQLVALLLRLQAVQGKLDLQSEGVEMGEANLEREEADIRDQLEQSSTMLNSALNDLTATFREINERRSTSDGDSEQTVNSKGFQPRSGRAGIDRLLLRIDSSIITE